MKGEKKGNGEKYVGKLQIHMNTIISIWMKLIWMRPYPLNALGSLHIEERKWRRREINVGDHAKANAGNPGLRDYDYLNLQPLTSEAWEQIQYLHNYEWISTLFMQCV